MGVVDTHFLLSLSHTHIHTYTHLPQFSWPQNVFTHDIRAYTNPSLQSESYHRYPILDIIYQNSPCKIVHTQVTKAQTGKEVKLQSLFTLAQPTAFAVHRTSNRPAPVQNKSILCRCDQVPMRQQGRDIGISGSKQTAFTWAAQDSNYFGHYVPVTCLLALLHQQAEPMRLWISCTIHCQITKQALKLMQLPCFWKSISLLEGSVRLSCYTSRSIY